MGTHLRRGLAQKSGPTPNRDQLRVFYNADEKNDYNLNILLLRTLLRTGLWLGPFWERGRAEDVFAFHEF